MERVGMRRRRLRLIPTSDLQDRRELDCGILDLKFSKENIRVFAVATSVGTIDIVEISGTNPYTTAKLRSFMVCDSTILVLQVAWQPQLPQNDVIAAALSDGRVAIVSPEANSNQISFVKAHTLEAWCVAWDQRDHTMIYSGGDDSALCINQYVVLNPGHLESKDKEEDENVSESSSTVEEIASPLHRNLKIHQAGVTAVLPLTTANDEMLVLTGSYDEQLRLLRKPRIGSIWQTIMEMPLGGGVWRLQFLDEPGNESQVSTDHAYFRILASCMHAGPKVVDIWNSRAGHWASKITAQFTEHESMNYANDARYLAIGGSEDLTIVSSSFYDRKLCLWQLTGE